MKINKLLITSTIIIISAFLYLLISTNLSAQDLGKPIVTGDYVLFGSYNGEKIKWRVINTDKNGYLLFSDKIISMKAYDSSGDAPGGRGGSSRKTYGNNDWVSSNIRKWLNSDNKTVNYSPYSKPDSKGLHSGLPYSNKPGFLYQFESNEKDLLVPVSLNTVISSSDKSIKDSGSENHIYYERLSKMLSNYSKAIKQKSSDKVFLLDINQLNDYVYNRGFKVEKQPTKAAIFESGIDSEFLTPSTYYGYFLRDAYSLSSCWVRYVSGGENVLKAIACKGDMGLVPALYIKPDSLGYGGSGSQEDPCYLLSEDVPQKEIISYPEPIGVQVNLKSGDYVEFGKYYGDPIKWRVINTDSNGRACLFSENIICFKAFDAAGERTSSVKTELVDSGHLREEYGSTYWKKSSLREWLNSKDQVVTFSKPSPETGTFTIDGKEFNHVWMNYNTYNDEPGFLSPNNFTDREAEKILPVTHKTILAYIDKKMCDGGLQRFRNSDFIDSYLQNYDLAYYEDITDKVFLLDVNEIYNWIYKNGFDARKKPTVKAFENSDYKNGISPNENHYFWLRTPVTNTHNRQMCMDDGLKFNEHTHPSFGDVGVVPALMLMTENDAVDGNGSKDFPYIIK